ncbi:uncharacterized protein LOC62_04G005357 [Vanrija pseudolonga]|uniref:Uncharacterized protein n=1 Tax=Vanrija pseudolonga TaxID=143232 RepID=A0AAF1BMA5_9TREE|nr:hypothetical protein LOC62_04G005357 [Vanrija pseudolonga]
MQLAHTLIAALLAATASLAAPIDPESLEARGVCPAGQIVCAGPNSGQYRCANPKASQYCCECPRRSTTDGRRTGQRVHSQYLPQGQGVPTMLARTLFTTLVATFALAAPVEPVSPDARAVGCPKGFLVCFCPITGPWRCANPAINQYCCESASVGAG